MLDFRGRRITVMGLGSHGGGLAATRYLAERGADVTVTDLAGPEKLADSLAALRDLPQVRFHLAGHDETDFRAADMLVVNPAVKPDNPLVQIARDNGVEITSETELFLNACPPVESIIGVTGSNGKSTTAAMLAAILQADGCRTLLGGNIGESLLPRLDSISRNCWIVLELSSFQLYWLSPQARLPKIAIVTNCTPNHLDWHPDYAHYQQAKQRLITGERSCRVAIFDPLAPGLGAWAARVSGQWIRPCTKVPPLLVPGEHNACNARLAAAIPQLLQYPEAVIDKALAEFRGLPHRLQFVGEVDGRRFYNDSKATTPAATVAALRSMEAPTWLLAGGIDKGGAWDELAASLADRACGVALFGRSASQLAEVFSVANPKLPLALTTTLANAFAWCWRHSRPGENLLLSPGCASYDQFRDYTQRGETFTKLVAQLTS